MKKDSARKGGGRIKATIKIGKKGVNEAQIKEISKQLEVKRKLRLGS
ncbi:MAG: hypothetical protein QXT26_06365 [Thermoproteota archaeon]